MSTEVSEAPVKCFSDCSIHYPTKTNTASNRLLYYWREFTQWLVWTFLDVTLPEKNTSRLDMATVEELRKAQEGTREEQAKVKARKKLFQKLAASGEHEVIKDDVV